jgi:tyrosine aminotransferase
VYGHCVFGSKPFVPMGVFGATAPVVTMGGISKRWMVPGWRLGWIAATDPKGILRNKKVPNYVSQMTAGNFFSTKNLICSSVKQIIESVIGYRAISVDPATFVQVSS